MEILHSSHHLFFRDPFGAVACGDSVVLRLRVRMSGRGERFENALPGAVAGAIASDLPRVWVRLWKEDREERLPMRLLPEHSEGHTLCFQTELAAPDIPGLLWYFFIVEAGAETYYYGNNAWQTGGRGVQSGPVTDSWEHPPSFQVTVAARGIAPEWYTRGIMYQIFVDRFHPGGGPRLCDAPESTGALLHASWDDTPFYIKDEKGRVERWTFFGGNLDGVRQKLSYLRSLGVSVLYLNPIFEASSSHKYDTGDYLAIDPMFGGQETFETLLREAADVGISIILDGVFSHTGADSRYFNRYGRYPELGAYQSPASPYASWYRFEEYPNRYECWWGVDALPNVEELAPSYLDFISDGPDSVIRTWLRQGIKGWRLDVADELPDEFIRHVRAAMTEEYPEAVLIGEVWEDASNKVSYGALRRYFAGDELHACTNYPFRELMLGFLLGAVPAERLQAGLLSLKENYPRQNFMAAMNVIGSHDRVRILTLLGEAPPEESLSDRERRAFRLNDHARELARRRMALLVLWQMTYPGVPCVYYGDEAGVEGYSDPYNRAPYPWSQEDEALLGLYRRWTRLRNEHEVFLCGDFVPFHCGEDVAGFWRVLPSDETEGEERAVTLMNRSGASREAVLAGPTERPFLERNYVEQLEWPAEAQWDIFDLESGAVERAVRLGEEPYRLILPPFGARILLVRPAKVPSPLFPGSTPRRAGVLLPLTALPSSWEIGDWGPSAYAFVDRLAASGQTVWQMLPLNPLGEGNSPYQSESAFALNPLLISPERLCDDLEANLSGEAPARLRRNILSDKPILNAQTIGQSPTCAAVARPPDGATAQDAIPNETAKHGAERIDYELAAAQKERILRSAFACWQENVKNAAMERDFETFRRESDAWLPDYALFKALRTEHEGLPWTEWPPELKRRELAALEQARLRLRAELDFHVFVQYMADRQQRDLRAYANDRGRLLMGDVPIFVAGDSADCWAHQELFRLDGDGNPSVVAGVPPDYFNEDGQRWGNPHYHWENMEADDFAWWRLRLAQTMRHFDLFRLDHFRGFEAYWQIDAQEPTAKHGVWMKGPGRRFFERLTKALGDLPLIAEDLGFLTPEVETLKQLFTYPGMKVLPFSYPDLSGDEATVYYTGTHDNDTLMSYLEKELDEEATPKEAQALARSLTGEIFASDSALVMLPVQDVLGLGSEARMNIPGLPRGNWAWRMREANADDEEQWAFLRELTRKSGRFH